MFVLPAATARQSLKVPVFQAALDGEAGALGDICDSVTTGRAALTSSALLENVKEGELGKKSIDVQNALIRSTFYFRNTLREYSLSALVR